jgi:hypothetical protein
MHGQTLPRPSFGYTDGRFFALQHQRAYPDVLSASHPYYVNDGFIGGRVCGLDVSFYSDWYGHRLQLSGKGQVPWPTERPGTGSFGLELMVHQPDPDHLTIDGTPWGTGTLPIDLDVSPDHLRGRVGQRVFDLVARGDDLVGRMMQHDQATELDTDYVIIGRQTLRGMSPSDEALLLITMLTCNVGVERGGEQVRGFALVPYGDSAAISN